MNLSFKHLTRYIAITGISVLTLSFVLGVAGMRLNVSGSIPLGVYWESKTIFQKGDYVIFCPPKNSLFDRIKKRGYIGIGFCEGGYGLMMKRVAAIEGDMVSITREGVHINGELLLHSELHDKDEQQRLLPQYKISQFTLENAEILLMGETSTSFDGRYFGPLHASFIQGVIHPVLIWK